jgi:hypothetical protein
MGSMYCTVRIVILMFLVYLGCRNAMSSFNCGGEHTLAACEEPRDPVRISQNRQQKMQQREQGRKRSVIGDGHTSVITVEMYRVFKGMSILKLQWPLTDGIPSGKFSSKKTYVLTFVN